VAQSSPLPLASAPAPLPPATAPFPANAFTVDVEDYFQVGVFQKHVRFDEWSGFDCRVERNLDVITSLLATRQVHATFFVLGWLAERYPAAIRRLADAGHEIASHGYGHRPIWDLTPAAFREDVERSQAAIGAITGRAPVTFRAPCFSVVRRTLWALDILAEAGIRYDSSIFPVDHPEYGIPDARRTIHRIRLASGAVLWEFPMTTGRVLGRNVAFCGGGYFRLLPYWLTRRGLERAQSSGHPFVFYMHPWEIDPAQPRLDERTGALGRFRHYVNLERTLPRLERLTADFRFGTMAEVFAHFERRGEVPEITYAAS
jgi:polysaccharide deacetylase family protein (PEP-CTERM system associated)